MIANRDAAKAERHHPHKAFSRLLTAGLVLLCLASMPRLSGAHPMGNFSINHFSALELHPTVVRVVYVIDMAEIPAFQEIQENGMIAQAHNPRSVAYRERKVEELRQGLSIRIGEHVLPLVARASEVTFPPGAGGLPTLRLSAIYEAPLKADSGELVYEDRNYPQRVGWKEIVARPHDGVRFLQSSVPSESRSKQLTEYTTDFLQAPPQDTRATLTFSVPASARISTPAASLTPEAAMPAVAEAQSPRSLLTELITVRQLSPGLIALSLLIALGLGALHALEPGHGKTLVAAYLVGSHGTPWHAVLLGLTVTVSHTMGVFALGLVALFSSHYLVPEQLYPWLELASGLCIVGTGLVLLRRTWLPTQRHPGNSHVHDTHDHHYHHPHTHSHPHTDDEAHEPREGSYATLLTLGFTGGMIPCPGALVVLLSAVALQRITFGMLLIVAFSIGLAGALVATGLLLVSVRGAVRHWEGDGPWLTYLPFLSSLVIISLGGLLLARSIFGGGLLPGAPF